MPSHQYHIEKFVHGGFGLSRDQDGRVTLLEGVIPGETITAKIWSENKNLHKGRPVHIIDSSPDRVLPACEYYRQCGGCNFQHMNYPRQLQAKKEIVKDLLCRSGHPLLTKAAETLLAAPLAAQQEFQYRQRIRLHIDSNRTLGFYKRRSNDCVPIKACLLAGKEINSCLLQLLPHPALQRLLPRAESLEFLFDPATKLITLLLHFRQKPRPADRKHVQTLLADINELNDIFFMGKDFAPSGRSTLLFTLPPLPPSTERPLDLSWETGGFCQVNLTQNQILIKTVLDFCKVSETDSVLDLFCGMGNFSIPIAEMAQSVHGVEGQASAIRSAKKNSTGAGQNNCTFTKQPVHNACMDLVRDGKNFDIVIIDPPRQGAPGLAGELSQLTRKRLIYISCDPATLCRDLTDLLDQNFHLTALQPVDMFPQTHHIECVALLEKSSENH